LFKNTIIFFDMRINRKDEIGGISILKIRDFCSYIRNKLFEKESVSICLKLSLENAELLVSDLLGRGFVEEIQEDMYQLTVKGRAFSYARCVSPMNKEKADKEFRDFMQRVEEVNNGDYLYKVEKLYLFGSYLNPESVDFADIDIAFELKKKIKNAEQFLKANGMRVKQAMEQGRRFPRFFDEVFYSEKEILSKLKNRSRISLHPLKDLLSLKVACRQVYPVSLAVTC